MSKVSGIIELAIDSRVKNYSELKDLLDRTSMLLFCFEWKKSLSHDFPILICILGGTGAGKSVLFNSLIEVKASKVGIKRPCTRGAVICCPSRFANILTELMESLQIENEIEIFPTEKNEFRRLALVDTPDFDSIETDNQIVSDRFFVLSDVALFVASQEKYADMAGRDVIRRSFSWKKEIRIVFNKATSENAFLDFQKSLNEEFGPVSLIRIDREIGAPEILENPTSREALISLLPNFRSEEYLIQLREAEQNRLRVQTIQSLDLVLVTAQGLTERVDIVVGRVNSALEEVSREMESRLNLSTPRDIEQKIQARLEKLLRKYDILYGPRTAIKRVVRNLVGTIGRGIFSPWSDSDSSSLHDRIPVELFEERDYSNVPLQLEASIAKFNLKVAELLSDQEDLFDFRRVALESCSRFSSEQIRNLYEESFPNVEQLLEAEFEKFKQGLSTVDEIKLYGSYTLWAIFLITAEVAIGGGLTLLDMVLNTAIGPFIPKWLLKLKIVDILREIGERIDHQRSEAVQEILRRQAENYILAFLKLAPETGSVSRIIKIRDELLIVS